MSDRSAPRPDAPPPWLAAEVIGALDAAEIGYALCDREGRVRHTSAAFRRTVGIDAPPIDAEPWFLRDCAPPHVKALRTKGWRDFLTRGVDWKGWVRWHDGNAVRVFEGTARPLSNDAILLISNDRSDRFEANRALAESEAAQRLILDDLPLSVSIQDDEGRLLYVNRYFPERLGIDRDSVIGLRPREVGAMTPDPLIDDMLNAARQRRTSVEGQVVTIKGGVLAGTHWVLWGAPITDRAGAPRRYLTVAADRTAEIDLLRQREQFARAVAQTQKVSTLNEFAATLAHELANILHPVGVYARLLAREPDRADREAVARHIESGVMTAGRILRRTLSMGRADEAPPRPARPRPIVEEVVASARDLAPAGMIYELDVAGDPQAIFQPTELRQVLINLLNNAADAQHYAGTIRLRLREDQVLPAGLPFIPMTSGSFVRIDVADEGEGVAEADVLRIFEPFHTTKKEGRGTGLGLPVALGLVTGWGGTISLESVRGQGATFTIWVPQRVT